MEKGPNSTYSNVLQECNTCLKFVQNVLLGMRSGAATRVAHILSLSKNMLFSCSKLTGLGYFLVLGV